MALVLPVLVVLVVGTLAAEDLLSGSRVSTVVDGFQVCAFLINPPPLAADLGSPAFLFHLHHRDPSPTSPFRPVAGVSPCHRKFGWRCYPRMGSPTLDSPLGGSASEAL
jgi:hypothetical protein